MTQFAPDIGFAGVVLLVTLITAFAGAARAGVQCCNVLFAGLFTMNYFEPLARTLIDLSNFSGIVVRYARFGCFLVLFASAQIVLWWLCRRMLPDSPEMPRPIEQLGRWLCGSLTGVLTAAILLTAVHTFPGSRDFGGLFPPEADRRAGPFLRTAPDYYWLKFTRYVSERVFPQPGHPRVFDGRRKTVEGVAARRSSFPLRYAAWRKKLHAD